ncbi:MAG: hypothetical protein ACR2NP_21365 [Pirellulaceae bacterium]
MWSGIREIFGWGLTLLGLALVGTVLILALNRQVFEAMALSLPSVIVFRAGIGLIRLNTAGRIANKLAQVEPGQSNSVRG